MTPEATTMMMMKMLYDSAVYKFMICSDIDVCADTVQRGRDKTSDAGVSRDEGDRCL